MGHSHGANRPAVRCCPERLDASLAEDTPVRFLDALVADLDLAAWGFQRAVPAATGRPGSAPGDLLKLSLYGALSCLRSRRRLEQETHRDVELLWLLKKLRPEHQPSAAFRKPHLPPMRQVCRTVTLLGKKLDLCGADLVAPCGSTFSAVNANERTFTKDKLTKLLAQIDDRVDASLKELARSDEQADRGTGGGAHAEALATQSEARKERKLLEEGFQAQRLSSGQEHRSVTDPERRAMKRGKGRGTEVCSNVQTAVEAKHQRIVACEVTNDPSARDWLSPMALQANALLDSRFDAVADVGASHGHAVKACLEAGITPYVPRPIPSANAQLGLFRKDEFLSDQVTDTYQCPAGALLPLRCDTVELGRPIRSEATLACGGCALKQQGTRRQGGRRSTRWVDEQLLAEMEPRGRKRPEVRKRRKEVVEHPFGTMKRGGITATF